MIENSNSMVANFLTKEIYEELKDKQTSNGVKLDNIINSAKENLDSSIGAYAGDEESYTLFAPLFDKIISKYHNFDKTSNHTTNFNADDLDIGELDKENKYIISTRIRVARNLANIPLGSAITNKQRLEIEKQISDVLKSLDGELKGNYYPLNNLSEDDKAKLINDHFLFKEGDRFLKSASLNNDWPNGRGIFHNENKTFLVWINEEDQLRIISMQKGGDIKMVFKRLSNAVAILEKKLHFAHSKHLGYITSCPTNLGTAMRASVHIKLPNLSKNFEKFKTITQEYHLQIRGIDGEHSDSQSDIFDISNKRRLGISEVQCVKEMYEGVKKLIKEEQLTNN